MASRQFYAGRQSGKNVLLNAHLDAKSLNDELRDNEDIRSLHTEARENRRYLRAAFIILFGRQVLLLTCRLVRGLPVITCWRRYPIAGFFCLLLIMATGAAPYLSIALLANLPPLPKKERPCFAR